MAIFCEPPAATETRDPEADITLTTPSDLLSAIPYLVGYIPDDSLVLVGLDGKRVAVTLRVDLPRPDQPAAPPAISAKVLIRNRVEAVVLVGYGPADRVTRSLDRLRALVATTDAHLLDAIRVTDGRYWSYVCTEPACCPPEGKPVNPTASPVDAAFTYGGMQALPHREAVTAQLAPVTGTQRGAVTRATNRLLRLLNDTEALIPARQTVTAEAHAILHHAATTPGAPLPDIDATVRLAAMLGDTKLQTKAMALVDSHSPRKSLDLWLWVTRHVAPAYRAIPASLLGFAAWRCGNGVLANEAVHRALSDDPRCSLALVLGRLLNDGIPPTSVPAIAAAEPADPSH